METASTTTAVVTPATASAVKTAAADVGSSATAAVTAVLRERWIWSESKSRESSKE